MLESISMFGQRMSHVSSHGSPLRTLHFSLPEQPMMSLSHNLLVTIVGVVVVVWAILWLYDTFLFIRSSLRLPGKVGNPHAYQETFMWDVSFVTPDKRLRQFRVGESYLPNRIVEGQSVTVFYNPRQPENSRVASSRTWVVPLILFVTGFVTILVGTGVIAGVGLRLTTPG